MISLSMPAQTKPAVKRIRFGHSPDPDDAFMFHALANQKIPMRGFEVGHVVEDIESLNQRALKQGAGNLEATAVSCHAYAYLAGHYAVMRSGASVGDRYGPILVKKVEGGRSKVEGKALASTFHPPPSTLNIRNKRIGIPGKLTTAYLVLQLFDVEQNSRGDIHGARNQGAINRAPTFEPVFLPFDQIFNALQSGKVDLGLIIHEGQITFEKKGFQKVLDLGQWWYEKHQLPLPLGVDVIRRDLGAETIRSFAALFKESIQYALDHRGPALEYAKQFGRGISDELNDRFVGMYVNDFTVDLGPRGEEGFQRLLDEAFQQGLIPKKIRLEFV